MVTTAMCRFSLIVLLLLAARPSWAAGKSKFIEGALAAVPVPAAGEFPTPEKVVTAYIEAFNANDLDAAMKCFIIRELYGKATWDIEARQMGGISGRRAFPGVDLIHYKKIMEGFDFVWVMLNRSRVAQKDAKGLMDAALPLSADPIESKRQLEEFEAPFREGLRTPIELVSLKRGGSTPQTPITLSVGATEYLVVFADTKLAGTPMELDFLVAKLGTNYRILTVVGPNGPPGLPSRGSLAK